MKYLKWLGLGLLVASIAHSAYSPMTVLTNSLGTHQADVTSSSALKVDGSAVSQPVILVSPIPAGANVIGGVTQSGSWPVQLQDGSGNSLTSTGNALDLNLKTSSITLPISAVALPLPSGAATESTLSTLNGKIPASLTVTSTRLLVDGSGVTQPISAGSLPLPTGASTESTLATLSGKIPASLTVTSTRLLVDGSGVTQPISVATLPLPTGASTDASAIETHGSASGGTAGTKSNLAGGIYNSAAPTLTTGQQAAAQLDVNGNLKVNIASGSVSVGTVGQGAPGPLASPWPVEISDGTRTPAIKPSASPAVVADAALVITVSPNSASLPVTLPSPLPSGTNSLGKVTVNPNTNGSFTQNASITSSPSTLTAPANAVAVLLQNDSTSNDCIRFEIGGTASSSVGFVLQPGQDTGQINVDANVSVAACSSTQVVNAQWVLSQ